MMPDIAVLARGLGRRNGHVVSVPHPVRAFIDDQTNVRGGRLVRVRAGYANEWGFSCRMADNAAYMGQL